MELKDKLDSLAKKANRLRLSYKGSGVEPLVILLDEVVGILGDFLDRKETKGSAAKSSKSKPKTKSNKSTKKSELTSTQKEEKKAEEKKPARKPRVVRDPEGEFERAFSAIEARFE